MKPFDKVRNVRGRSLFIFEHGLGDLINFLPVYYEFIEQNTASRPAYSPGSRNGQLWRLAHASSI